MANSGSSIKNEAIREFASGSITAAFQAWGGILTRDVFRITIVNNTNGDIYISTDGTTNNMKMSAGSGRVFDNKTNDMFYKKGTQFYIKFATVPGAPAGWAGLEIEYV